MREGEVEEQAQGQGRREAQGEDRKEAQESAAARLRLALLAGLMLWLLTGILLFSDMGRLHPRYTEGFIPAVAGTLGIGVAWATDRSKIGGAKPAGLGAGTARGLALSATLLAVVAYAEPLLFGTTAVWWIAAAAGAGAIALAWTGRLKTTGHPAETGTEREPIGHGTRAIGHGTRGYIARGDRLRAAGALVLALVCLLAIPLWASLRAVRENVSDTTPLGVLHPGELRPLSSYLRAHQGTAYYEAAFDSGTKMGELVERDARPILVLTTLNGQVFTPVARLRALAAAGKVRYAFLGSLCGPHSPPADADCSAPARWVAAHGTDVSARAGMPRTGMLWRLPKYTPPPLQERPDGPEGARQMGGSMTLLAAARTCSVHEL
jgi:hypothetical protein